MRGMRWMVAALVLVAACQKASDDDVTAIGKVRDAWAAAWKSGNGAQLAALYDENAADMTNHMSTSQGRIAIASAFGAQFAQFAPSDMVLNSEKTEVSGNLAYDYGTYQFSMTPTNGGPPMSDSGRYLVVLKKQGDGTWKLMAGMDNSTTPLSPQPQPTPAPPPTTTSSQ